MDNEGSPRLQPPAHIHMLLMQMMMIFYLFLQKQQISYRYIPVWVNLNCEAAHNAHFYK